MKHITQKFLLRSDTITLDELQKNDRDFEIRFSVKKNCQIFWT